MRWGTSARSLERNEELSEIEWEILNLAKRRKKHLAQMRDLLDELAALGVTPEELGLEGVLEPQQNELNEDPSEWSPGSSSPEPMFQPPR